MHEMLRDIKEPHYEAWNQTTFLTLLTVLVHRKVAPDYTDQVVDAGQDDVDCAYNLLKGYLDWNYKTPQEERTALAESVSDKYADQMNQHMARMQYFQQLKSGESVFYNGKPHEITIMLFMRLEDPQGWFFHLKGIRHRVSVNDCEPIGEHRIRVQVKPGKFKTFLVTARP